VKKTLFIALALTLVLAACNKKAFLKKLEGNWKINTYLFDGHDRTTYFDTTYRFYNFDISSDNRYSMDWKEYAFSPDSAFLQDTIGYDSVGMVYIINYDTLRFIDTTITARLVMGEWTLLNSDEDLQLRPDSDATNPQIYRILDLDKSNLKLKKGNEEFYYKN